MKKIVMFLIMVFLTNLCTAAFTTSIDDRGTWDNPYVLTGHVKDKFLDWCQEVEGTLDGTEAIPYSTYTPTDTEPGTTAGMLYYDLSENKFKYYNGGSWVAIEAGAVGNSLDGAYDVGRFISADAGTVTITASNAADNAALTLIQEDTGSTVGASITSAGTGALLSFDSNGTGADLLGSDSTWNVSKAGVGTFIGLVTSTGDVTFTGAAANIIHDASANQLEFTDSARLVFGTSDDIIIAFDGAGGDLDILGSGLEIAFGANDEGIDVIFHGETASTNITWDESADELVFNLADLKLSQNSQIEFIATADSATDWTIDNATPETLLIYPTETDGTQSINLGNATNTTDLRIFGETASTVIFDATADNVIFNAYDIQLNDDDVLAFGDGKDIIISQSSANLLTIGQTVAGVGEVAFGINDAGLDVKMFGDTASAYWLWDTSADTMVMVGGNATITTDDAEANQFKVDATGEIAGDAIVLETTNGGIMLDADGAENGDIEINAADDVIITAAGKVTITNTEAVTISGTLTPVAVNIVDAPITDAASVTLTAAMSGKILPIGDLTQNTTIDLPAEADGLNYEFWYTGGATEVHDHVIDAEANANFFIGGVQFVDSTDNTITPVYSNGSSNAKITLNNLQAGSYIKITCDGTNWYITGIIYSDTIPTFADAV